MRNVFTRLSTGCFRIILVLTLVFATILGSLKAQDSTGTKAPAANKKSYVKKTFDAGFLIDEQTVMVPVKGTFEFDINHRFGNVNNGMKDFFGIFSSANTRLAVSYVPYKDLQLGFGFGNHNMTIDGNLKYAILKQTKENSMPVSVTYYGLIAMNTMKASSANLIVVTADRFSYFNQILVARKFNDKFSAQAGIAITHYNNVEGYLDSNKVIQPKLNNNNWTFCVGGRYKVTPAMAIIVNYDQPLTQNAMNNPHPNLSFGLEMSTSGHTFQFFAGNYQYTIPTYNTFYNQNDYKKGQFVIGFNISRLWNF